MADPSPKYPTPSPTSPRLVLRPLAAADAASLLALLNTLAVGQFLCDGAPVSAAFVAGHIVASAEMHARLGTGLWHVALRTAPEDMIGVAGLFRLASESRCSQPELLIALAPSAWGQGLGQEAAAAVVADAEGRLAWPRVLASTDAANVRCLALLERLGFVRRSQRLGPNGSVIDFERRAGGGG